MSASNQAEVRVSSTVKVVVAGDDHEGRVGKVEFLADESDDFDVYVHFDGDPANVVNGYHFDDVVAQSAAPPAVTPVARRTKSKRPAAKHPRDSAATLRTSASSHPWIFGVVAGTLLAVVVVGTGAGTARWTAAHEQQPSQGTTVSTESGRNNGASPDGALIGSLDDWRAAVCNPGTFHDSQRKFFPDETASGYCQTGRTSVVLAQFDSDYLMRNDLLRFRMNYFAWGNDGQRFIVFATVGYQPSALQPLAAFGFKIESGGS